MKVLKIKGSMVVGDGMFSNGRKVNLSGIIAVKSSQYQKDSNQITKYHPVYLSCVYFDINNQLYVHLPKCTIVEAEEAGKEAKCSFIKKMAKANLYYSENDELLIKAPDKVKFIVDRHLLTRAEILNLSLQGGQAFNFCWDNGFSYCGSEPATKEQYLMAVDKALAKRFSFGETCGILISDASQYGETFAIKVCIGADKRYSEVSFS